MAAQMWYAQGGLNTSLEPAVGACQDGRAWCIVRRRNLQFAAEVGIALVLEVAVLDARPPGELRAKKGRVAYSGGTKRNSTQKNRNGQLTLGRHELDRPNAVRSGRLDPNRANSIRGPPRTDCVAIPNRPNAVAVARRGPQARRPGCVDSRAG